MDARLIRGFMHPFLSMPIFIIFVALLSAIDQGSGARVPSTTVVDSISRSHRLLKGEDLAKIHRTSFHFQPAKNWMNGPLYYKGYYHLFYQYNPDGAIWSNIQWGHVVSNDLIHVKGDQPTNTPTNHQINYNQSTSQKCQWQYLPPALFPDHPYDAGGCWSGSATILPNGTPVLLYTGASKTGVQTQCQATPADPSDPFLTTWIKDPRNPVVTAPTGVNASNFRDPTTAWLGADGRWRALVGARRAGVDVALVYETDDFLEWGLREEPMRTAPNREGMWEVQCPDFYPVNQASANGLDTSAFGTDLKFVLKASFDDSRSDHYSVGNYDPVHHTWTPVDASLDVQTGPQYDYGRYYASKSFYDPLKERRVVMGWVNESDTTVEDIKKGWASVQALPRKVYLDPLSGKFLVQEPIEEVEGLRGAHFGVGEIELGAGSEEEVKHVRGTQLDIEVTFTIPTLSPADVAAANRLIQSGHVTPSRCSPRGSAQRNAVGPVGILVMAAEGGEEATGVYVEMIPVGGEGGGEWETRVCTDQTRASLAVDGDRNVYGERVRVMPGEREVKLRVIVDNSIVEVFAQGGRTVMTARVYPTLAHGKSAGVRLFNNGSVPVVMKKMDVYELKGVVFRNA